MKLLNFHKLSTNIFLKIFIILLLSINFLNPTITKAEQTDTKVERLTVEPYACQSGVNQDEYDLMSKLVTDSQQSYSQFVTFLEQPLSTKNNVFIKETCSPSQSATGRTIYNNCEPKVTCKCTPQFPDISKPATDEKSKSIICRRVQFIVYTSGQELAAKYVNLIYRWVSSIVGIVAVIYIIVNAIMIASAQNDSGQVTAAKERIIQSLIALVVLLCASLILYAINPTFFRIANEPTPQTAQQATTNP